MSWAVVVPSNRPERFTKFLEAWKPLFEQHNAYPHFVWDLPDRARFLNLVYDHCCWDDIPDFIPRKTDMIRSWGIYKAWQAGSTYTLSLDDDVLPEEDIFAAYEEVFDAGAPCSDYLDVGALTSFDGQMRGFPFGQREKAEVAIQYGGWHGVLDYDAPTQLAGVNVEETFAPVVLPVPRGAAVTGCAMNMAWRTEYAPIMWQLPLLDGRFNRFGDIWSCLFQKRVLDALGKVMVINGKASVRHERASDPIANLERETPGIRLNEAMWDMALAEKGVEGMIPLYRSITENAVVDLNEYEQHFLFSRDKWLDLFA